MSLPPDIAVYASVSLSEPPSVASNEAATVLQVNGPGSTPSLIFATLDLLDAWLASAQLAVEEIRAERKAAER